jgi:hypothetical protein
MSAEISRRERGKACRGREDSKETQEGELNIPNTLRCPSSIDS